MEGKTGVDLEDAVKKWENQNKEEVGGGQREGDLGEGEHKNEGGVTDPVEGGRTHGRSQTPDAVDTWFKIPLTAMFKRSLSAPASQSPEDLQQHSPSSHEHIRQASLGSVFANVSYDTPVASYNDTTGSGGDGADHRHAGATLESIGDLSPLVLPSLLEDTPARWNNVSPRVASDIDWSADVNGIAV